MQNASDLVRELSRRRDDLLEEVAPMSRARRAALDAVLAKKFPVETTLHEIAVCRDHVLSQGRRELTVWTEAALCGEVSRVRSYSNPVFASGLEGARGLVRTLVRSFRVPACVAAACLMLFAGILLVERWNVAQRGIDPSGLPALVPLPKQAQVSLASNAVAARDPFSLTVNEMELAAVRNSLMATGRLYLEKADDESAALRLDLAVKPLLVESGLWRTP